MLSEIVYFAKILSLSLELVHWHKKCFSCGCATREPSVTWGKSHLVALNVSSWATYTCAHKGGLALSKRKHKTNPGAAWEGYTIPQNGEGCQFCYSTACFCWFLQIHESTDLPKVRAVLVVLTALLPSMEALFSNGDVCQEWRGYGWPGLGQEDGLDGLCEGTWQLYFCKFYERREKRSVKPLLNTEVTSMPVFLIKQEAYDCMGN